MLVFVAEALVAATWLPSTASTTAVIRPVALVVTVLLAYVNVAL